MKRKRKRVAILGSTGSIGTQALDVIARFPDRFEVVGLAAGKNVDLVREQAQRFECAIVTSAHDGAQGLHRVAVESRPDILLAATDGAVAFDAVFAAVERGIDVAVANKELIVAAGELLMASARRSGSQILPVDSEHSAIFQCLVGERLESVARILLTASGGPFLRVSREAMEHAGVEAALAHPTWRMGRKNTIDSATMMNKGLEVIEASRLFGVEGERIGVVIHPQSIVHGFVLFMDGSVKAQLAAPDMRLPIGYALAYPERLTWSPFPCHPELVEGHRHPEPAPCHPELVEGHRHPEPAPCHPELVEGHRHPEPAPCHPELVEGRRAKDTVILSPSKDTVILSPSKDTVILSPSKDTVILSPSKDEGRRAELPAIGAKGNATPLVYDFQEPDFERFPCLGLAYEALARGGTAPAVLSAANEVAVEAFIEERLQFGEISRLVESVLAEVELGELTLEGVRDADRRARKLAEELVGKVTT